MEKQVQVKIAKHLRKKGCFVIITKPQPGTAAGTPDILFLYEGFWGVIECKRSAKAPFRPLQKELLDKLGEWSFSRVAYPENVDEVIAELDRIL